MSPLMILCVLVTMAYAHALCSWPCEWQQKVFYNAAADVDLVTTTPSTLVIGTSNEVITCFVRSGPFFISRRGNNVYRCVKENVICKDAFVIYQSPLFTLDTPPEICEICTPGNLTTAVVWIVIGCDIPKNCAGSGQPCDGCEKDVPDDGNCCRAHEKSYRYVTPEQEKPNYYSGREYYNPRKNQKGVPHTDKRY